MRQNWLAKSRYALLAVALVLAMGHNVFAAPVTPEQDGLPPLIDRELFFGDPEISSAQISPDANYISFIKPYKGVRNIWVKKRDQAFEEAHPITADERPVFGYFWSQDSKYVLYVQDKGGDENYHIYAVDPSAQPEQDAGVPEARDLTPLKGIRAIIYAVPKRTPNEIIVGLNDRDAAYHDVYRVNLTTGERELLIKNTEKVAGFSFDLEGKVRLATRQLEDGGFEILRVDGDTFTQIYTTTFEESAAPLRFHKDGKRFYMITNKGEDVDLARLVLFNPETMEEEFVESDPENEVDFGGASFDERTDELIATFYVGDRVRIYPKTEAVKRDLEVLKSKLPEGEISLRTSSADMRYHIVSVSRDVDPGSVYLYDREGETVELLYRSRPELNGEHLAHMKPIRYKARDGREIPAYLTLPKGIEAKNLPVVIYPHGGPWARDIWGYDSYAQFFANRGYAVLQPNFRGSTGYGKNFLNAGNKEWGTGAMQHDISDGVKYLIEQGIADPKRVAIFGGSYGGYATLAGLAFTPELYAAGMSYVGPSNLITLLNSIPPYWGPFIKIFHKRLGNPEDPEDRKQLMKNSPLFSADKIAAPLLVIQGANDPRVKKQESDQIVVALRERGLPVEYIVADNEGHGFRAADNRLATAAVMEKFLAQHIGGRYQKEMSEEIEQKVAALSVDINSVELPDNTLSSYAATAPLPQRSSEAVRAMETQYGMAMQVGEQKFEMEMQRSVTAVERDGRTLWQIISKTQSPMGTGIDTIFVDQESLAPIARRAQQGMGTIRVDYSDKVISGQMKMGPRDIPIEVKLDAPVLADGPGLEITLVALPLAEGYETTIRTFDLLSQKVRPWSLKVTGVETIEVKAGSYEAYKVELSPLDGEPGGMTVSICTNEPRCVVRNITKLPAAMGGGTLTTELSSIGDLTAK